MNLRISNLSIRENLQIIATHSANLFDEADVATTTDTTLMLVPNGKRIEGTINLIPNNTLVTFITDMAGENVIVSSMSQPSISVPLNRNIAIEWNDQVTQISGY